MTAAASSGGGLACYPDNPAVEVTIANCTITNNSAAADGGGLRCQNSGTSYSTNSILWGNTAPVGHEISLAWGDLTVWYSGVQGGQADVYVSDGVATLNSGDGNTVADPQFADPQMRLLSLSPCVVAGDNDAVDCAASDLDGHQRCVDDRATDDTGHGTPPIVDVGPYEYPCGDGLVQGSEECDDGPGNSDAQPDACRPDSDNDAWFEYTAPCNATHVISTEGTVLAPENDTVLSVYDACDGDELACDDDSGDGLLSKLTFEATADTTYHIRVAGVGDNVGEIGLNISTIGLCIQHREPERIDKSLRGRERTGSHGHRP